MRSSRLGILALLAASGFGQDKAIQFELRLRAAEGQLDAKDWKHARAACEAILTEVMK